MSKKDIELDKVQKAIADNTRKIKTAKQNAVVSEVHIKTYESQIKYQDLLHNDRVNKFRLQIDRAVENSKLLHDRLEELLKEKEALHIELTKATHLGQELCEFCKKYYTPQGLSRHKASCSMKPAIKIVKKHEKEIKIDKEDLEARKAELKKALEALDKW